ncbi:hypothetical protein IE81DRAFT_344129 [Ceraceosorus guamensis]|uniref:Proteophosphoglycan ppg4 n=1 Tax=Ceraceosorus guamensis TaxID=1522189 RepID=A0A316W914_9BASI|nr:hypothetical protein IE81DRAFT_344129 [Ceraceosorus guamensis]PWN46064.1 hypothetical protein IE81DRAFT_344129 [Ceraceosorus guamensis]
MKPRSGWCDAPRLALILLLCMVCFVFHTAARSIAHSRLRGAAAEDEQARPSQVSMRARSVAFAAQASLLDEEQYPLGRSTQDGDTSKHPTSLAATRIADTQSEACFHINGPSGGVLDHLIHQLGLTGLVRRRYDEEDEEGEDAYEEDKPDDSTYSGKSSKSDKSSKSTSNGTKQEADSSSTQRSRSSGKTSSETASESEDSTSSSKSSSSKTQDASSSAKEKSSTSKAKQTSTGAAPPAASQGSAAALPVVTPMATLPSPTPSPLISGQALGVNANADPPAAVSGSSASPSSRKAQLLAAQLSTARQRALDASRLANGPTNVATYAAGGGLGGTSPSASFGGGYSSPAISDSWISPAPGDAFTPGMEVVLTWRQQAASTPGVALSLCVLSQPSDLRAARAGRFVDGGCGQSTSPTVSPSVSGQPNTWEIRFPAPSVSSADSFYVLLAPASSDFAASSNDVAAPVRASTSAIKSKESSSASRTLSAEESSQTKGWSSMDPSSNDVAAPVRASTSAIKSKESSSASRTLSAEESSQTKGWSSMDREKKDSKESDEEDGEIERRGVRYVVRQAPDGSEQMLSPAFVLAPTGTDLSAVQAPPPANPNDQMLESQKSGRSFPIAAVAVPLAVVSAALLIGVAMYLYRRGQRGSSQQQAARMQQESNERHSVRREMEDMKRAASMSVASLALARSCSGHSIIKDGHLDSASMSSGPSYGATDMRFGHLRAAPRQALADAYTPVLRSTPRRYPRERFGGYSNLVRHGGRSEYAALGSTVGAGHRRAATTYSTRSEESDEEKLIDYRRAHEIEPSELGESVQPLLSRSGTASSVHPSHTASSSSTFTSCRAEHQMPPPVPAKPPMPCVLRPGANAMPWEVPSASSRSGHVYERRSPIPEADSPMTNPFSSSTPRAHANRQTPVASRLQSPSPLRNERVCSSGAAEVSAASGKRGSPAGTASFESVAKAGEAADLYEKLRRALGGA